MFPMKILLAIFFALGLVFARAQSPVTPEPMANVAFFNATGAEKPLFLDWSGQDAFPDGLASGRSMGPLMIPATNAQLEAKIEGYLPVKGTLKLSPGGQEVLIFWAGPPEADKGAGDAKRRLRIIQLPPPPSAGGGAKDLEWPVVLVGLAESAEITVNGQKVLLRRGKPTIVAKGQKFVQLKQGDRELAAVSVEGPSDYIFVVYGDKANGLSAGVIYR